jgi:8-oxo-dGTP pyrophosphatase MutT (NUDIX family)
MTTDNPWKLLEKNERFDCPYFTVRSDLVSLNGGSVRPYNSVRMKVCGVAILPIDADGCTTLVGQYRYVLDRYSWELPGGGAARDRPAMEAARQELAEETGYQAEHWLEILASPVAPGTLDEIITCYVAWGLRAGEAHPGADEQLAVRKVGFATAVSMALAGEIGHISSIGTILSVHARLLRSELPPDLAALLRNAG